MTCLTCAHLKIWYHGTDFDPGNFTYTCAMTGLSIDDPKAPPPDWCPPAGFSRTSMLREVLDALEEVLTDGA